MISLRIAISIVAATLMVFNLPLFAAAPVANHDSYATFEDGTLAVTAAFGVLANDTDADGNLLTAVLVSSPTAGLLTLNASGSFTYSPGTNFNGVDSFTYRANDGALNSGVATVTITVTAVNDAPAAVNDSYSVAESGTLTRASTAGVLANDADLEANSLTVILISGPNQGSLTMNDNGAFTYVHNGSETTSDSFTYRANDGSLNSGIATVTITITPVNDAPVANSDSYIAAKGTTLSRSAAAGVLANDTDAETNSLSVILITGPSQGSLTMNNNGAFTYVHSGSDSASDSFTYRANDGFLNSGIATVSISVISNTSISAPIVLTNRFIQIEVLTIFLTNVVEASTNLTGPWTPIATNLAPDHKFGILETNIAAFGRRFYRIRSF